MIVPPAELVVGSLDPPADRERRRSNAQVGHTAPLQSPELSRQVSQSESLRSQKVTEDHLAQHSYSP